MRDNANRSISANGKTSFPFTSNKLLQAVQHVNQLPQPPVVAPIESKRDARALDVVFIGEFFRRGVDTLDLLANNNIGKIFIHGLDGRIGRRVVQPDDKQFFDKPARMELTIETGDAL